MEKIVTIKIIITLLLFLLLLLLKETEAQQEKYVSATADREEVRCTVQYPCSLDTAFFKLNDGDILYLSPGIYGYVSSVLVKVKNVTIQGDPKTPPTILCNGNPGFYFSSPSHLLISHLFFSTCFPYSLLLDPVPPFIAPTFSPLPEGDSNRKKRENNNNNNNNYNIRNKRSNINLQGEYIMIQDVVIENCDAGINITGATPTVYLVNTTFSYNRVSIAAQSASLYVSESTFMQGAIAIAAQDSDVIIEGSSFSDHSILESQCGAIQLFGGTTTITETKFNRINCNNIAIRCPDTEEYTSCSQGGVIYSIANSLNINNSVFTDAISLQGGAIASIDPTQLRITDTIFNNCTANSRVGNGGAIILANSDGVEDTIPVFITNSTFSRNKSNLGGAIASITPYFIMHITNCTFLSNFASAYGGAVYQKSRSTEDYSYIRNTEFINNSASNNGGAVFACAQFVSSRFVSNSADLGGSVYCDSDNGYILLSKSTFVNSKSQHDGGGLYSMSSVNIIDACNFINCSTTLANSRGGGVFITFVESLSSPYGITYINSTNFFDNQAPNSAAVFVATPSIHFNNSTFRGNVGLNRGTRVPVVDLNLHNSIYSNGDADTCSLLYNQYFCGTVWGDINDNNGIVLQEPLATCKEGLDTSGNEACSIYIGQRPSVITTNGKSNLALAIALPVCLVATIILIGLVIYLTRRSKVKTQKKSKNETPGGVELKSVSVSQEPLPIPQDDPTLASCYVHGVEIGAQIGSGAFGTVYEGSWNGARVAVKTVSGSDYTELIREALVLQKLGHPNIVHFLGIYKSPKGLYYMVTEFVSGGNLESLLRSKPYSFSIKDLIKISLEVAAGMRLLEQKGVIHRDLAARNVLVDSSKDGMVAKVSDFGMSRVTEEYYTTTKSSLFPVKWAAPEVILYYKFSSKSDVWAMGVVLWEIFSMGEVPYHSMTNKEASDWVLAGNRLSFPARTPPLVSSLASRCWSNNADERPTFVEIYSVLTEAFIASGGTPSIHSDSPRTTSPSYSSSSSSSNRTPFVYTYQDGGLNSSSSTSSASSNPKNSGPIYSACADFVEPVPKPIHTSNPISFLESALLNIHLNKQVIPLDDISEIQDGSQYTETSNNDENENGNDPYTDMTSYKGSKNDSNNSNNDNNSKNNNNNNIDSPYVEMGTNSFINEDESAYAEMNTTTFDDDQENEDNNEKPEQKEKIKI